MRADQDINSMQKCAQSALSELKNIERVLQNVVDASGGNDTKKLLDSVKVAIENIESLNHSYENVQSYSSAPSLSQGGAKDVYKDSD